MLFQIFFAVHCLDLIKCVQAGSWDDFVNNLSTDLAPLISLFGETVTKQWLSESLTVWDNLLFAMGPLGVITAVVSAIRVAGSPSLKAFIGRAQESPGTAELELLSCTSGTTAELWNEGGIARVFGRPHILEVVVRSDPDCPIELIDQSKAWSMRYSGADASKAEIGTEYLTARAKYDDDAYGEETSGILGSPNLSLNIGIKRKSGTWFQTAALVGVLLQLGVLTFGALSVYTYPASFPISPKQLATTSDQDGFIQAPPWAFPVTFSGTMLLCFGMFLCAFMIERRSHETYFRKEPNPSDIYCTVDESDGDIYWIQMGDQNVGDQVFHAFIAKHPDNQLYIRSQKRETVASWESGLLWFTLMVTLLGFAMQFVGLRYLHPAVALAQLGFTIFMTIIRSSLRTQRLSMDGNLISGRSKRRIDGHELDFFALSQSPLPHLSSSDEDSGDIKSSKEEKEIGSFHVWLSGADAPVNLSSSSQLKRIFRIRSQLAGLTSASGILRSPSSELTRSLEWKDFEVRTMAVILKEAIEGMMKEIYKMPGRKVLDGTDHEFSWIVRAELRETPRQYVSVIHTLPTGEGSDLELKLTRDTRSNGTNDTTTPWKINRHELEAILGLWSWSKAHLATPFQRILASCQTEEERAMYLTELNIWVPFEDQSLQNGWGVDAKTFNHYGFRPSADTDSTLFISTDNSCIMMCAQDLFMSFLLQVVTERIETFGGKTSFRESANTEQATFQLQNAHLDAMVTRFEESGLGSRDDAYGCIFSTLHKANKQPLIEDSFPNIQKATELVPDTLAGFQRSEMLLQWVEDRCKAEYKRDAKTSIGEFYRKVIIDPTKDGKIRELAFKGLVAFGKSISEPHIADVNMSYAWIGREIAREQNESVFLNMFSGLEGLDEVAKSCRAFDGNAPWNPDELAEWFSGCNSAIIKYVLGTPGHKLDINTQDAFGRTALSWAAEKHPELGLWILKHPGINQGKEKIAPILYAAEKGHSRFLESLLEMDNTSINKTNLEGKSSLMLAVLSGNKEAVRVLLKSKYSVIPSAKDNEGRTALHFAAAKNHLSITRSLVGLGTLIEINELDNERHSALDLAAQNGNTELTSYLVAEGAILFHPDNEHFWSALCLAARGGHEESVKRLFAELAVDKNNPLSPVAYHSLEHSSRARATALLEASIGGHLPIVQFLLANGADVNCLCEDEHTAVFVAAAGGFTSVVALLYENGADLDIVEDTYLYKTPLSEACDNCHTDTVIYLLSKGAAMYRRIHEWGPRTRKLIFGNGVTGNKEIVRLLVHDEERYFGSKFLNQASEDGDIEIVQLFLDEYEAVGRDYTDWPMVLAAEKGHLEIIEILAQDRVERNQRSRDFVSAFERAKTVNAKHPTERAEKIISILESQLALPENSLGKPVVSF